MPLPSLDPGALPWGKDEAIVLICRSGRRSIAAAQQLAAAGFTKLYNLRGGMMAWNSCDEPVCRDIHAQCEQ